MTRETKIGLLVGLAFIILFGIILSEKGTRNEQFATPNPAPPLVELVPPTFTPTNDVTKTSPEEVIDAKVTMNDPAVKMTKVENVKVEDVKIETPGPSHMIIKQNSAQQPAAQQEISPKFKEMLPPTPTRALSQIPASATTQPVEQLSVPAIPTEMSAQLAAIDTKTQTPAVESTPAVKTQDHVVAPGETIASICRQYYPAQAYTMVGAVLKANRIANPQKLQVGQTLKLPNVPQQVASADLKQENAASPETAKTALASSKLLVPAEDSTLVGMIDPSKAKIEIPVTKAESKMYTVQDKDTLTKIAKRFYGNEKAWTRIYEMNKQVLKNPHALKSGINLKLPAVELAAGPKVE
jgi:nucleoid-associated protein YgaU